MAKTTFTTNDALTKKVWEEKLYRDVLDEIYWKRFTGKDSNSAVQEKTQLEKEKGDKITFGIRMELSGSGVTSGQQLEGNEEDLTTHDCSVTLEQYRHAVRDDGALSRQRAMFSIDVESRDAIKEWMSQKVDKLHFTAILDSPTKIFYKTSAGFLGTGTAATAKSALTTSDGKISLSFISALRTWASTGGNRSYTPIRPIKVDGEELYVLLVNPDCLYDLRTSSNFIQANREARERGKSNPIFKNATAFWDGVVIHEHRRCTAASDAGASSNVPWAKGVFFGAQALVTAYGRRPKVIQKKFDYDNEDGYAMDSILGVTKPVFNSKDYGSLGVYLARTDVSGQ